MSASPSISPLFKDEGTAQLVTTLVLIFFVLLSLLIAVLVAIVVYKILIRCLRESNKRGYAPIRLLRAEKDEKELVAHDKRVVLERRQKEKSDHHIVTTSSAQLVLSYIEDLAKNKSRIDEDWKLLQDYNNVEASATVTNQTASSVISIFDDEHHKPKYLVGRDPQFGCAEKLWEAREEKYFSIHCPLLYSYSGTSYWPSNGTQQYGRFMVRLVSEHKHDSSYVIRSFIIAATQGGQFSSTVTQYHLLNWPHLGESSSVKLLLEFRRKVNQSMSTPVLIHCNDGVSCSGTYCLIDMVLNRICRGVREVDVSATLEHLRDYKQGMVPTKEFYELAIATIVEGTQDMFSDKL